MALTVQTNNAAITALKHLNTNNMSMNRALERLSSGFRINSAADDASGYAISSKLNAQGERLKAAVQNGMQATAMVKMADAAVNEIQNMIVRVQTLAIQGSSANNTAEAAKLDAERIKLEGQIDKIANGTNYNGVNLLNGVDSTLSTSAVASTGQSLANGANTGFSAVTGTTGIYENATFAITTTAGAAATSGTLTSGFAAATANVTSVALNAGSLATAGANGAYFLDNVAGVVTAYSGTDNTGANLGSVDLSAVGAATTTLTMANGVALDFVTSANVAATTSNASSIASAASATGGTVTSVKSTVDLKDDNGVLITAAGTNILAATQNRDAAGGALTLTLNAPSGGTGGTITVTDVAAASQLAGVSGVSTTGATAGSSVSYSSSLNFQVGDANNSNHQVSVNLQSSYTTSSLGLGGAGNLLTASASAAYIDTAIAAIDTLTTQRADLGATTNQLSFVNANLSTAIEQVSAAVSSIQDADMAAEMTNFTKSQILVQAGTSMLAQANQASQNVLSLFR